MCVVHRVCVFLCTCHLKMALSSSFSLNKERCHVLTRLWRPLVGFPPPPFSTSALTLWLHVSCLPTLPGLHLDSLKKSPGKIVGLSSQEYKLLFLLNL
uniref:Secreted protein n=1 Tax=Spermophilus dauricus TaxID=99837 RepID=A0A8C9QEF5_SPEDA